MKPNHNLIQVDQKHNDEIHNYSLKGVLWKQNKLDTTKYNEIKDNLNLDSHVARLAAVRSIKSTDFLNYINPKIKNILPDPFVLDDMEKATNKIVHHIKNKKKIGILGDYDVDGASATALLCNYLSDIDVDFEFYIPDRIREGYGPNVNALINLKNKGCELILTLDCGTSAVNCIKEINKENVDIIIVDHHLQSDVLPDAFAIINPQKKKDISNLNNLCATGVVFFLIVSINRELRKDDYYKFKLPNLVKYLDLVALATICDLVKLDTINRAFVKQGLKVLNKLKNTGIAALVECSSVNQLLNEYHLGFVLGPRINAGGRVGDSKLGVNLLTSKNKTISLILSNKLCSFNDTRRAIETKVLSEAMNQINENSEDIICVHGKDWHPGVLGIVAAKITEKYRRPSIVISEDSDNCSASCRSVKSFDIGAFIIDSVNSGILISGGGHKMAGGFCIKKSKIKLFKDSMKEKFKKNKLDLIRSFEFEIPLSSVTNKFYNQLQEFAPFGMGNPKPKFLLKNCHIKYPKIVGDKHVSFFLADDYGNKIKCIYFNSTGTDMGSFIESERSFFGIVVSLLLNLWGGNESVEILVEDIIA
ncbi:MAG: single-stranded-DNA-specific exonuclease RecJ [Alphaproteobacteria bacterium]